MIDQEKNVEIEIKKRIAVLKREVAKTSDDLGLREDYAALLSENGYAAEAVEQYKILISMSPKEAMLYYNLGEALEKANDMNGAIFAYKQCLHFEPDNVDAHYNLAYALDRVGNYKSAMEEYKKTIELDPEEANAYFNLGCIYSKWRDSDKAMKYFNEAIRLNPADEYAHFYLAYEKQQLGNFDEAMQGYRRVLEINPDYSWAYFNMAYIYIGQKDYKKAYDAFKNTYRLNPGDTNALKKLIETGIDANMYDEILNMLEDIIIADQQHALAHYYIAEIYYKQKEYEDALHHYKKAYTSPRLKDFEIDLEKLKSRLKILPTRLA